MDMFVLDWGRGWIVRLRGRNPLVRKIDRLETLLTALAVIVVIAAIPVAVDAGAAMKDARLSAYAQQATSRHEATATALGNATMYAQVYSQTYKVRARWAAEGTIHVATVSTENMVHAGDRFSIWIDEHGDHTTAPIPPGKAATDALRLAVLLWLAVAGTAAAALYGLHRRLNRHRNADWDRELSLLVGNDGGRTG